MNGLQRGTLTQMNPGFMDYIWDNFFKPLQNEWVKNGHTHRNEPRIYCYLYGTIFFLKPLQDEWVKKGHTDSNSQT